MTTSGAPPLPAGIERLWPQLMSGTDLHLHQLDWIQQAALFVQLARPDYQAASFLDGRSFSPQTPGGWFEFNAVRQAVLGAPPPAKPLHFIFHMGHTGSTLMSRLLDETGEVFSLREPLALRTFADLLDRRNSDASLASPQAVDEWGEILLRLWSRCAAADRCASLKATSTAGRAAEFLMAARPDARALYLSMAPEPYLAVILGGPSSLMDVRGHAEERARRLIRMLGGIPLALHKATAGQLTALSWVAEAVTRERLAAAVGQRLLKIDFDRFLAGPEHCLDGILDHFGLAGEPGLAGKIATSAAMGRYAKAPEHAYSTQLRNDVMNQARQTHRGEIARGMQLLEEMARDYDEVAALM